jgi:hypothetical protein
MSNNNNYNNRKKNSSLLGSIIKLSAAVVSAIAVGESAHKVNESNSRKNAMDAALKENNRKGE